MRIELGEISGPDELGARHRETPPFSNRHPVTAEAARRTLAAGCADKCPLIEVCRPSVGTLYYDDQRVSVGVAGRNLGEPGCKIETVSSTSPHILRKLQQIQSRGGSIYAAPLPFGVRPMPID